MGTKGRSPNHEVRFSMWTAVVTIRKYLANIKILRGTLTHLPSYQVPLNRSLSNSKDHKYIISHSVKQITPTVITQCVCLIHYVLCIEFFVFCLCDINGAMKHSAMKKNLSPRFPLFLHILHTFRVMIFKLNLIEDKDNLRKPKVQFFHDNLTY